MTIPEETFTPLPQAVEVAVIGGGVSGLAAAWRLAQAGRRVAVFERGKAGSGASRAATGMLAAAVECEPGEEALLALALHSQRLWPDFRRELEAASGLGLDYRNEGTLVVALGREEVARLRFRYELQRSHGLEVAWLAGTTAREREPALRPSVSAAILSPGDHLVDPRLLVEALARAFKAAGGLLFEDCAVEALETAQGRVAGLRTAHGPCRAEQVLLAAGAWSGRLEGLPPEARPPIRPLRGQALALCMEPGRPLLSHVVWSEQVHLAPRSDGRLIVGATVEECGFRLANTAGGVYALLEGLRRVLPAAEELEIAEIWSALRPTSRDDAPLLGPTPLPGLLLATGHHRNGILLAPATAEAVSACVLRGGLPAAAAAFAPARFDAKAPAAE